MKKHFWISPAPAIFFPQRNIFISEKFIYFFIKIFPPPKIFSSQDFYPDKYVFSLKNTFKTVFKN